MENKMFQKRLKELRKEKKLSQEELGEVINVSGRTISYFEAGERTPSPEILSKLADIFKVSVDYLLGRTSLRLVVFTILGCFAHYIDFKI
jgi:transcriptional regulator with XRE-family HTH domain